MSKRVFDILVSLLGLIALAPLFALVAILIKLASKGPAFFLQERVGRNLQTFRICKFRTMVMNASSTGGMLTAGRDPRITGIGHLLRKTKFDELPQLFNVLWGEMSLVGPRPEVPQYVNMFRRDYEEILSVRPGITDLASLKYRDEQKILGLAADPEQEYVTRILPDKITLAKEYIRQSSFFFDLSLLMRTLVGILEG